MTDWIIDSVTGIVVGAMLLFVCRDFVMAGAIIIIIGRAVRLIKEEMKSDE